MECRQIVDSLSSYLDGLLPDTEAGQIERHLASCAPCQTVKLELSEICTAARDLPLHTPPRALWTRVSNVIEADIREGHAATTRALPKPSAWERFKTRNFTFSLPQIVGAGALAVALVGFSSVSFYRQYNSVLTLRGMQTAAIFAEEANLKIDLDRKLEGIKTQMNAWDPQQRANFDQRWRNLEDSLQKCRLALQANPRDEAHQAMLRSLYQEKRQMLEDFEKGQQ